MLFKKQGFPEENEIVVCTVTKVQFHSVFVNIDEYNKQGMIHISEISPGRIRNIRDYVKEGKVIVCKVLRINKERGHIDLSLRRVGENQRREKINSLKQEQIAEKIIEFVAKKFKKDLRELYKTILDKVFEEYGGVYPFFEDVSFGDADISYLKLPKDISEELKELIIQRIKPAEITKKATVELMTYDPKGIEIIKKAVKAGKDVDDRISIKYKGGGKYVVEVTSTDFKEADSLIEKSIEKIEAVMKKNNGIFSVESRPK